VSAYGTIIVVGGGCYGSYYVRQLDRAAVAGALTAKQVLVVDRSADCQVLRAGEERLSSLAVSVVCREWSDFFADYLDRAATDLAMGRDAIVPSPLMPHLMYDWLEARARQRWPAWRVERAPIGREPSLPWQRAGGDGTHYVSFAEWICPVNCVEPPQCPEIAGPRSWSMPSAMRAYVAAERARGRSLAGPALMQCTHRAYGVGMFDTEEVLAADRLVNESVAAGAREVLIGTVSHCHGALTVLTVDDGNVARHGGEAVVTSGRVGDVRPRED